MKKRLLSLLVALCMAVTLLPVSAITAWAEESGSNSTTLRIENGYPVGSIDANGTHTTSCSGDGWSYDGSTQTLDLHPASSTEYDFFFQLLPAMEMSPNVNSRLEEMQPLLGEISTTL